MDELAFFRLTGARAGGLGPADGLRPALFARFADLTALRYDFPLVALAPEDGSFMPLSQIVDDALAAAAPKGVGGERMRRSALRVEREIRTMLARGDRGDIATLWPRAVDRLAMRGGEAFVLDASAVRAAIKTAGVLIPCESEVGSLVVSHIWREAQARKATRARQTIDALAQRLGDLVRADLMRSETGRRPEALRAGVGTRHQDTFDFTLMATLLSAPSGATALTPVRRARIERTIAALRRQRFFAAELPYVFAFDRVEEALAAYADRLPAMAGLVRAMSVAELELRNAYDEERHDEYFARFDERSLTPQELALFPDYLVRLHAAGADAAGRARIVEGLTSGAPLKIVFVTDDAFGLGAHLATTAMGLGDAYVVQSSAAQLYRVRDRIAAAIDFAGAALISVFAPTAEMTALPPYLVAGAATESRAFPTFAYDPAAGMGWKERFALLDDAARDGVWTDHELEFADADGRRTVTPVSFTLADLALADARRANELARVPRALWSDALVPVASAVSVSANGHVPFVYAVDADAGLHKVAIADRLVQLTRRCAEAWRRLRELDDLKREPLAAAAAAPAPVADAAPTVTNAAAEAGPAVAVAEAPVTDEPYIETPRCTTCNECTNLNPRAFAYNENKQAFIKDAKAASYRELVEAAENCQVAIIHPGKPRDPAEPGLDDLVKRAESFR